jgi:hypothetical protein
MELYKKSHFSIILIISIIAILAFDNYRLRNNLYYLQEDHHYLEIRFLLKRMTNDFLKYHFTYSEWPESLDQLISMQDQYNRRLYPNIVKVNHLGEEILYSKEKASLRFSYTLSHGGPEAEELRKKYNTSNTGKLGANLNLSLKYITQEKPLFDPPSKN